MTIRTADRGTSAEADDRAGGGARLRRRLRRLLLGLIGLLYLFSVPWYRETSAPLVVLFGLPDWVAVALGCYVAVALLNALAWLLTDVSDDAEGPEGERPGGTAAGEREP